MPYVDSNGIKIHYEERGSGDPLLLIMGITAPGSVWEDHAAYWEEHFRCILVDNRGVGRSDKPESPYTMAQMADDYAGLMDALDIPKARVVGVYMAYCPAVGAAASGKSELYGTDVSMGPV